MPEFEGFTVDLAFLSAGEITKINNKCTTTKFNRKTRQPEDIFDNELFYKLLSKRAVKGWSGFKWKYAEVLLPLDLGDFDPEDEVPFNEDNVVALMTNSKEFSDFVTENLVELRNFTKRD